MERMINTCIAAPDINTKHPDYPTYKTHCFIFLKNKDEWNYIFLHFIHKFLDEEEAEKHISSSEEESDSENSGTEIPWEGYKNEWDSDDAESSGSEKLDASQSEEENTSEGSVNGSNGNSSV